MVWFGLVHVFSVVDVVVKSFRFQLFVRGEVVCRRRCELRSWFSLRPVGFV